MNTLNPGYKFLSLLAVSLILSFTYSTRLNLAVFGVCLLLCLLAPGVRRAKLLLGALPFFAAAAGLFFTGLWFSTGGGQANGSWGQAALSVTSLQSGLQLATRVLAFGAIGLLFAHTTSRQGFILSLMQQFCLPPQFAYGILAAFHFIPAVQQEYGIVKAAQKVRGVRAPAFSPKRLVPMLVHALAHADSIAMAMESRGFCGSAPRKQAVLIKVRPRDFLFLAGSIGGVLAGLLLL
ncbi:MAG: energy-coupling factor transporter transmembrane component T [Oscillospiraceae bacterium]